MYGFLAAVVFFTRIPLWKWIRIPDDAYRHLLPWWPAAGWITGGVTALVMYGVSGVAPLPVAVVTALIVRVLLTGGLHEDGLADFFDGLGGGTDREKILAIMKDSRTGSYGVLSLVLAFLLYYSLLTSFPVFWGCLAIGVGDPLSKAIASMLPNTLPYARSQADSKSGIVYPPMRTGHYLVVLFFGLAPFLLFFPPALWVACILPLMVFAILYAVLKMRLGGYTGDCCGAVFILCELSFYFGLNVLFAC